MANTTVVPAPRVDPETWRKALQEIRGRHHQAEHGWCAWCAYSWPCPDRQAADEALRPTGTAAAS
jgi:hypothetical protein